MTEIRLTRQQKRALARELAKGNDVRGQVETVLHHATATAFDITAEERKAALKEKQDDTIGQMLVLIIAYMRMKRGHRGEWLCKFTRDFNEFCNDMMMEKASVDQLLNLLQEETGVDFQQLLLDISAEEKKRIEERQKVLQIAREKRNKGTRKK